MTSVQPSDTGDHTRFRVSRPCYDKYTHCPGQSGGGWKWPKVERCVGGYVPVPPGQQLWTWRLHRCDRCRVWVLPYRIRYVDPSHWLTSRRVRRILDDR